jgi:hypothetical protein
MNLKVMTARLHDRTTARPGPIHQPAERGRFAGMTERSNRPSDVRRQAAKYHERVNENKRTNEQTKSEIENLES